MLKSREQGLSWSLPGKVGERERTLHCPSALKSSKLGPSKGRFLLPQMSTIRTEHNKAVLGPPLVLQLGTSWGGGGDLFKSTFLQNLGQGQPRGGPQQESSRPRSNPGGKAKPHGVLGCSQLLNLEFSSGPSWGPAQHLLRTTRLGSSHQCAGSAILTGNPRGPRSPFSPWTPFSPFAPSSPASPCREGRWVRSQKTMAQTTHPCTLGVLETGVGGGEGVRQRREEEEVAHPGVAGWGLQESLNS